MTSLEVCRRIADAVFYALHPRGMGPNRSDEDVHDPPTQAVIRVLHETGSWICRWEETPEGGWNDEPRAPIVEKSKPSR